MDGNEGDWGHYEVDEFNIPTQSGWLKICMLQSGVMCSGEENLNLVEEKHIKLMKSQIMEFQFAAILKLIKKRCRLQTEWNDIDFRIPHRQWFGLVRFRVNQGFFPITISDDVIHGKRFRLERFWVNQFFLFSVMKRYM